MLKAVTMATMVVAGSLMTAHSAAAQYSPPKPKPAATATKPAAPNPNNQACDPRNPATYCNPKYSCPTPAPCAMTQGANPSAKPVAPKPKTDSTKKAVTSTKPFVNEQVKPKPKPKPN